MLVYFFVSQSEFCRSPTSALPGVIRKKKKIPYLHLRPIELKCIVDRPQDFPLSSFFPLLKL